MKLRNVTLHKPFLFFGFLFFCFFSDAQNFPIKNYPKGYFAYPVGAKIGLAANFGELRPNHYHMGLDCKTDQKQNMPVYAAADGYIAHVKIDATGFGRAIYINHPNGLTTLYGHLNDFFPELENYVKSLQYEQQTWSGFFDIPKELFPVKKMQFIAYSGNTGGSQGPHVHFEIRDTKTDKVLNPLLFGFPIEDNVPPLILRLAMYDRSISTYSQSPKIYKLKIANGIYSTVPEVIIVNTNKVSFGISAFDRLSSSANTNGIYEAILYNDSEAVDGFQIDSITYDETRYLNAHIDYKMRYSGGPFVEHLSRLPGYPESVYKDFSGNGVIDLSDDSLHQIRIVVKDAYGNQSNLEFAIRKNPEVKQKKTDSSIYFQPNEFHPGFVNIFDNDDIQLILGEHVLYDSISFSYIKKSSINPNAISDVHAILSSLVPAHDSFTIRIKPDKNFEQEDTGKIIMQKNSNGKIETVKAIQQGEWFTAHFRNFGNFQLLIDKTPPVIIPIGIRENANLSKSYQIAFRVHDDNIAIKNFRAELDGKWLRFTNDKELAFIYKFDEMCPPGNHELKIIAEDEAGNTTSKIFHFTR